MSFDVFPVADAQNRISWRAGYVVDGLAIGLTPRTRRRVDQCGHAQAAAQFLQAAAAAGGDAAGRMLSQTLWPTS
jgi:hypothetical protein